MVRSADGRTWRTLPAEDSPAQQQVSATISELEYYGVGVTASGTEAPFPVGRVIYLVVIFGWLAFVLLYGAMGEWRRRRSR